MIHNYIITGFKNENVPTINAFDSCRNYDVNSKKIQYCNDHIFHAVFDLVCTCLCLLGLALMHNYLDVASRV
jgi:hypothetical protein